MPVPTFSDDSDRAKVFTCPECNTAASLLEAQFCGGCGESVCRRPHVHCLAKHKGRGCPVPAVEETGRKAGVDHTTTVV